MLDVLEMFQKARCCKVVFLTLTPGFYEMRKGVRRLRTLCDGRLVGLVVVVGGDPSRGGGALGVGDRLCANASPVAVSPRQESNGSIKRNQ